jgi:adenine-specific DNA-methyltransferase
MNSKFDVSVSDNIGYVRKFPDSEFKLIMTSPPYNNDKEYETRLGESEWLASQKVIISECVRVLSPNGSICWQVGNSIASPSEIVPLDAVLYPVFKSFGLKLRNRIVWHFGHGLHCTKRFSGRHETILWFTKGDSYTFNLDAVRIPQKYPGKKHFKGPKAGLFSCNPLGANPGDVWLDFPNVKANHCEKTPHPCQYPVALVERLVLALTNTGDKVLDPYVGSGTTIVAAVKNGREGYGCDTVTEYVEIAKHRLDMLARGELKTRPIGKPIYSPKNTSCIISANKVSSACKRMVGF